MINDLAEKIKQIREDHGFYTPWRLDGDPLECYPTQGDLMLGKLMLVVTEVSEAAEAVRKGDFVNFREEMIDVIIRCLDICATCEIDIEEELDRKIKINSSYYKRP